MSLGHFWLMYKPSSRKLTDAAYHNEQKQRELCSLSQNAVLLESHMSRPQCFPNVIWTW